jgi:hypothetical protein
MPICPTCQNYCTICPICKQETDFELMGKLASEERTPTILKKDGGAFVSPKQRVFHMLKCLACGGTIRDIYIQGKITKTEIPKPEKKEENNGNPKIIECQDNSGENKVA